MSDTHCCWECGNPAPSGVCSREHPGFSLIAAKSRRAIIPSSGTNAQPARTWLCDECGQYLTALGIGQHKRGHERQRAIAEAEQAKAEAKLRTEVRRALREEEEARMRKERAMQALEVLRTVAS